MLDYTTHSSVSAHRRRTSQTCCYGRLAQLCATLSLPQKSLVGGGDTKHLCNNKGSHAAFRPQRFFLHHILRSRLATLRELPEIFFSRVCQDLAPLSGESCAASRRHFHYVVDRSPSAGHSTPCPIVVAGVRPDTISSKVHGHKELVPVRIAFTLSGCDIAASHETSSTQCSRQGLPAIPVQEIR